MDPTACWNRLVDAMHDCEFEEAAAAALDLREWQAKGGFMPPGLPAGIGARLRDFAFVCQAVSDNCYLDSQRAD